MTRSDGPTTLDGQKADKIGSARDVPAGNRLRGLTPVPTKIEDTAAQRPWTLVDSPPHRQFAHAR